MWQKHSQSSRPENVGSPARPAGLRPFSAEIGESTDCARDSSINRDTARPHALALLIFVVLYQAIWHQCQRPDARSMEF
jgi:hypothetical protein